MKIFRDSGKSKEFKPFRIIIEVTSQADIETIDDAMSGVPYNVGGDERVKRTVRAHQFHNNIRIEAHRGEVDASSDT